MYSLVLIHNWSTQQTRNHFWTSWHVSNWFIIGTAPPVRVFMCIHVNSTEYTCSACCHEFLPSLTWAVLGQNRYGLTGTCHHVKTRDFTVNTCRHTKFVHTIWWIHVRKHVNWASWTCEVTYRTYEITGCCLLEIYICQVLDFGHLLESSTFFS